MAIQLDLHVDVIDHITFYDNIPDIPHRELGIYQWRTAAATLDKQKKIIIIFRSPPKKSKTDASFIK